MNERHSMGVHAVVPAKACADELSAAGFSLKRYGRRNRRSSFLVAALCRVQRSEDCKMTKPQKTRLRLTKVAVGAAALVLSVALHAQARDFSIPAGNLKAALDAYIAATGQQIVYKADDVKGRESKGAQGAMTPDEALAHLLEGTNLQMRRDPSGAVLVFLAEKGDGLFSTKVTDAVGADGVPIMRVVVTGTPVSHLSDTNRTGTRMDADPMTLPMTVTTVSSELLQQQQAVNLSDAVSNVAGVVDNGSGLFTMRGFTAGMMRNGNLQISGVSPEVPMVSVSRIEVVKGPEAIIAGVSSGYGGVINIITKTPETMPIAEVTGTVGSRGYYEAGVDLNKPLTEDKTLLARVIVSKQGSGKTEAGFDGSDDKYFAPSVTWRHPSTGTELTAQYEYQKRRADPGLSVITNSDTLSSHSRPYRVEPAGDGTETTSNVTTLSFNQRIVKGWDVALKYSNDRKKTNSDVASNEPGSLFGFAYPSIFSFGMLTDGLYVTKTLKAELKGEFSTGPIQHKLLASFDSSHNKISVGQSFTSVYVTDLNTGAVTDLSAVYGPAFGGIPSPRVGGGATPVESDGLLMDQMTWGNLIGLVGFRHIKFDANNPANPNENEFNKGLPSLGLLYRLNPDLSLYASASKGFTPNAGNSGFGGTAIPPEDAKQYEGGIKALMFDRKIAATFSMYRIDQQNVAVPDPLHNQPVCGGTGCYISVPGVKATGAELEVSGEIGNHVEIRTHYTYNVKKADAATEMGVYYARNEGSLWAAYRFSEDPGEGAWIGTNIVARSGRNKDPVFAVQAKNPGQTRIDLNAGFDATHWSLVGGIKNLTNRRLYDMQSGFFGMGTLQQTREVYLTARYNFY